MIGKSHIQIAEAIYHSLDPQDHIWISKRAFLKGSAEPDSFKYRYTGKHILEDSLAFVNQLVDEILNTYKPRHFVGHLLGELIHFFTDYAVAYHSNPNYNFMYVHPKHLAYELKCHRILKKTVVCFEDDASWTLNNYGDKITDYVMTHHQGSAQPKQDVKDGFALSYAIFNLVFKTYKEKFLTQSSRVPIKVAIFTDTYLPQINGVSNTLFEYARYLENEKIQYVIISPKVHKNDQNNAFIERLSSFSFWFYKEARIGFSRKSKIHNLMQEFDPDIIHVMTEFTVGSMGLKYAETNNIPVITNYSSHFTQFLKHLHLGPIIKPLQKYISAFHRRSKLTTTPSLDSKDVLEKEFGITNVQVFGRGINTRRFSPSYRSKALRAEWGATDKIAFLCVTRISGEKNLELLFEAYQTLAPELKDRSQLIIVGDGPMLETYKKNYPFATYLGYQTGQALSMIYASADVFVFPSHTETLGNVVLEAMASGIPPIVVNRGGVLMNVTHQKNGWVVDYQDSLAYKNAMEEALHFPQMITKFRTESLKLIEKRSWSPIFKELIHTYLDVIHQPISLINS